MANQMEIKMINRVVGRALGVSRSQRAYGLTASGFLVENLGI